MENKSKEIINRLKNIQNKIKNEKKNGFKDLNKELLNKVILILEKTLQHLKKK